MGAELTIPVAAVSAVLKHVKVYGRARLETGGFFLAATDSDKIAGVALAGTHGITRRRDLFQVSELALERLFSAVDAMGFWLPIQFHSHERGAFLSLTDSQHGLRVEDFISVIIPQYGNPPGDLAEWGWWQFSGGDWRTIAPAAGSSGGIDVVISFDEEGIHGH